MILEWFELVFIWDKVLKCCVNCLFTYALCVGYLLVSEVIVEPELERFRLVNCSSGFFRFDCRLVQVIALAGGRAGGLAPKLAPLLLFFL